MPSRPTLSALFASAWLAACISNPTPHPATQMDAVSAPDTHKAHDETDTGGSVIDLEDVPTDNPSGDVDGGPTPNDADALPDGGSADVDAVADAADTSPPAPPVLTLTVDAIPATMNGSIPWSDTSGLGHPFMLRVNRENTTLDALADLRAGGPVDWATLVVTCSAGETEVAVGDLVPADDGASASHAFTAAAPLPDGATVSCRAEASGPGGSAKPSEVTFQAATLAPERDPFATEDVWLVVLSRDIFALVEQQDADGTVHLTSEYVPGGNGVPDFIEPFYALGLMSHDNPAAAEIVRDHLLRTIRRRANAVFGLDASGQPTADGVRMRLYFEGDPGAPDPADFAGGGFSMIALGGDGSPADQAGGTFGRALIDWNNQGVEDDTVYGLGVFPTALVRAVLAQPIGVYLLADLLPSAGGVPIGGGPDDALFIGKDEVDVPLSGEASDRQELYALGVDLGGLALSSILCHEIGHSLGLVPFGPAPEGLFAGVDGPVFLESFAPDAHIDTAGLNIMQTGASVNWTAAFGEEPRFNPLNWAYLRRQLVVGGPTISGAPGWPGAGVSVP